jgi:flagellar motor protein MotB
LVSFVTRVSDEWHHHASTVSHTPDLATAIYYLFPRMDASSRLAEEIKEVMTAAFNAFIGKGLQDVILIIVQPLAKRHNSRSEILHRKYTVKPTMMKGNHYTNVLILTPPIFQSVKCLHISVYNNIVKKSPNGTKILGRYI